ncbi:diguanylate cyclase [Alkalihalophilus pseudofirmus]|uniref:sensor domain-containing diguanylate cyclase n=1 Tax=Alkalihalophilus pseudofirmus TaxID=79885 RepID=UPI00259BAE91|nr:sensor domain-containing diguanylate cyclase [Alkalihalophilus pseudofirmus]WEG17434.1 diguanylate cyclase [Alkalihalophilus pseudofirmus]
MDASIQDDRMFEQAFRYSTIGLVILDIDGTYLKVNEAYCQITNRQEESILSQIFIDHIHPLYRNEVADSFHTLLHEEKRSVNQEVMLDTLSESDSWVELSISLIRDDEAGRQHYLIQVQDLTIQRTISSKLKVSEAKLNQVIETVPSGLVMMDQTGIIIFANQLAEEILKVRLDGGVREGVRSSYNAPEWKNRHLDGRPMTDEELPFSVVMRTRQPVFGIEHMIEGEGGEKTLISVNAAPLYDEFDQITGVLCSITDITAQKITEQQLLEANLLFKRKSEIDGLTGIPNRRSFDKTLQAEWDESERAGSLLTLIMLDLDSFKHFNDTYGHQKGDDCLREVAAAIDRVVQDHKGFLARYGGEEFTVIKRGASLEESRYLAEEIKEVVYQLQIPHQTSVINNVVTVSVGVAVKQNEHCRDSKMLFDWADQAMYQAKKKGRNQVLVYNK